MTTLKACCMLLTDGDWIETKDQSKSGIRLVQTGNIGNGEYLEKADRAKYISEETFLRLGCTEVFPGDILVSRLPEPVGRACLIPSRQERMITAVDCSILRVDESIVSKDYLLFFLRSPHYFNQLTGKLAGTTRTRISRKNLERIEIDIPNKITQKRVVEELSCVSAIMHARQKQIAYMDDLIKARFVEMFGDPVVGDKIKGNKHKIGDFSSVTKLAGFEFTKYINYKESGDIIMLRGLNCKKGHLVLDDIKWIDKETSDLLPRSKLFYGDILITYAGTIGDVAMVDADDRYHLAPNVGKIAIEDKDNYNPVYLIHLLMYSHDYIMTFASQVAQASINMEKIRNFEYYFPPIDEQIAFASFVAQVDQSRVVVQKALDEAQLLFDSLMQKFFS